VQGVGHLRERIFAGAAASLDLGEAGVAQDLGIALAAAFVVAAVEAPALRQNAGIAGVEQRRAFVSHASPASLAITSPPAPWIAMPAVAVCDEPPAMPESRRSSTKGGLLARAVHPAVLASLGGSRAG
jgi:hypothetical protein